MDKVKPDFFHRKAWQVFHNLSSSDVCIDILNSLAELFGEMEEEND